MKPISIIALRHAPTRWNHEKRIQGRTNTTLDDEGIRKAKAWSLESADYQRVWFSSPLQRCIQTGAALGLKMTVTPELIEMDWGTWDGQKLSQLRAELPAEMAEREAMGLDFRPENGESPRDVQARIRSFISALSPVGCDVGLLTHKGVIRALIAEASGWNMEEKCPVRLATGVPVRFQLAGHELTLESTA